MARRNRTAEILAAARLVPAEIAREQEQTRRASATSQALASLVPALIQGGVDIYGGVTRAQRAAADDAADLELRREALGIKREALAKPAKVDPYAEAKNARAEEASARAAEALALRQREAAAKEAAAKTKAANAAAVSQTSDVYDDVMARAGAFPIDTSKPRTLQKTFGPGEAPDETVDEIRRATGSTLSTGELMGEVAGDREKAAAAAEKQKLAREEMARKKAADAQRAAYQDALLEEKRAAAKEKAEGRPLPAEVAEKRALKTSALNLVDKVREAKRAVGTGSVEGRAQKWGSSVIDSPDWAEFKALSETLKRTVGRVIEGGKMAAGDEIAYDSFLNNPTSLDEKEYDRVVDVMEWILTNDLDAFDSNLQGFRLAPRPPRPPKPVEGAPAPSTSKTTAEQDIADGLVTPMGN